MLSKNTLCIALLLLLAGSLWSQPQSVSLNLFAGGFDEPVDITHAGDERIFIVERGGVIHSVDPAGNVSPTPFLDIDNIVGSNGGERGLLGLAFSPDYANDGFFFVHYTDNSGNTVISRFSRNSANPQIGDPASEVQVLTYLQPFSNHNGGDLEFDAEGYLLISSGDGGSGGDPLDNGQDDSTLLGALLRIDPNNLATIPPANPNIYSNGKRKEILAYGLRNPWRFSIDPVNQNIWIGDVGQEDLEEIDLLRTNDRREPNNFGWRCYEGNQAYNSTNCAPYSSTVQPVHVYQNIPANGCSVTGGRVYRGARYQNLWGTYFYADFCSGKLWYMDYDDVAGTVGPSTFISSTTFNVSSFGEDVHGQLYLASYGGGIYRIEDTTCAPKGAIREAPLRLTCDSSTEIHAFSHPGFTYQWYENGQPISGATDSFLVVTSDGNYQVEVTNPACGGADLSDMTEVRFSSTDGRIFGLPATYPENGAVLDLDVLPVGATLSGPGISQTTFDPAAAGSGLHTIYVASNGGNCDALDSMTIFVQAVVGVEPPAEWGPVSIYPIPARHNFTVDWEQFDSAEVEITFFNALGQRVLEWSEERTPGLQKATFTTQGLSAGTYTLRLRIGEQQAGYPVIME